ncbi:unnamed protein product [Effrenium voratum]|nr:unnamed protein product [Effrenium voratum]
MRGAESEILRHGGVGGNIRLPPFIMFEYHRSSRSLPHGKWVAMRRFLEAEGYEVHVREAFGVSPRESGLAWQDPVAFARRGLVRGEGLAHPMSLMPDLAMLAWGERNDPYLFKLFCERKVLSYFVGALLTSRTAPSVRLQLLVPRSDFTARREASFCCLLSDSEWNELLTGQHMPELPNEECLARSQHPARYSYFVALVKGLALRVDNGLRSRSLALGEARSKCIFPLFQQEPLLWRPTRLTWCEPPPERPISVAHAQLIPRLADSLRASWAFMTLAVQRGDAYSFRRFGARGHLGAHRRAAAAQDARAHGGNDHPEQDALARMSFAGRAFKFKLLW